MLYKLFLTLTDEISALNVFRYITMRIILAALSSVALWFFFGPRFIRFIKARQVRQYIRAEGPESHQKKAGTPTMGGIMVLAAAMASCLLWADVTSSLVVTVWIVTLAFAAIGFRDDYLKIRRRRNEGLSGKKKLLLQVPTSNARCLQVFSS